jgi:LAGLIDADG endonuclease
VYPVIKITFAEKDFPLANKLFLLLPFGKLYKKRGKYYNLVFYKLNAIFLIVNIINGKMRTPKIEALYRLIDWFNLKYNTNLEKLNIDTSDLGKNAWLSGLLECDSCFSCFFNINKTGIAKEIHCYMRLSQRQNYNIKNSTIDINNNQNVNNYQKLGKNSYYYLMEKIRIFLNVNNLRIIKRIRKDNFIELGYEIRTSKKESNNILINYLNNYPLYSNKYLDYLDWKSMFKIKINKEYKENKGTKLLISLKSSINNNRINFNWEHLNNFWKI